MEDWGSWIHHDNLSWPSGVEEEEEVILEMVDGRLLGPKLAETVEWVVDPESAVARYKRNLLR